MRESAAVYSLFQLISSTPGGVGAASGYLYLKPGTLFMTSASGSAGLDGGNDARFGVPTEWKLFGRLLCGGELLAYDQHQMSVLVHEN